MAVKTLVLIPLVVSLFHIDKCTRSNSEPEKCYPIKRTIGSLLSWSKLNDIAEAHRIQDFIYTHHPVHLCERGFTLLLFGVILIFLLFRLLFVNLHSIRVAVLKLEPERTADTDRTVCTEI